MKYVIDADRLTLVVPGNPTTGYTKSVHEYNTDILELIKSEYRKSYDLLGSGGNYYFYFYIKKMEDTEISIANSRTWDPDNYTIEIAKILL